MPLFQRYDVIDHNTSVARWDRWAVPPELSYVTQDLRRNGCITLTRDLAGMSAIPVVPAETGGAAIAPVSLHAGVVTNDADDALARAFFEERGILARSIGKPGLGRRIYLGPFQTANGLGSAKDLALEAGFVAPYPVRNW